MPYLQDSSFRRNDLDLQEDDDRDQKVWRRGLALPERKKENPSSAAKPMQQKNSKQLSEVIPEKKKINFVPAPTPKSSAWGSVTKPQQAAAPLETATADHHPRPNVTPVVANENKNLRTKPAAAAPLKSAWGKPRLESHHEKPQQQLQEDRASASARLPPSVPPKSPWNLVPTPKSPTLAPTLSYPPLQQSEHPKSNNNKKKKSKGGTLGDVMPKALLKKGSPGQSSPAPAIKPAATQQKKKPKPEEFPALSASTKTKETPKRPKVAAPIRSPSKSAPANTNHKNTTKKKKKNPASSQQSKSKIGANNNTPVVLDAHRSGMLFGSDVLQHMQTLGKGRQRIRPRTKKFSSLKKKVLEERLQKYRATQQNSDDSQSPMLVVAIHNYIQPDDDDIFSDPEEYEELVENLRDMASKVGEVTRVWAAPVGCTVEFRLPEHVAAAVQCWNGLLVAGKELRCEALDIPESEKLSDPEWKKKCEEILNDSMKEQATTSEIVLEKMLTEEDLEDSDCLEESLGDIKELAAKFGTVEDMKVENTVDVRIVYKGSDVAQKAATELSQLVLGGQQVEAKVPLPPTGSGMDGDNVVYLDNILTEDDLEDEDCLEESLGDVRELAGKFGSVESLVLYQEKRVTIHFASSAEAQSAVAGFQGMVIGGQTVAAVLANGASTSGTDTDQKQQQPKPEPPKTLYSGDKIISERFAACKRVPKIVNSLNPRPYATPTYPPEQSDTVKELLFGMLGELMRLQKRAAENEKTNTKAKRRLVMGLREVARGIRSHKVKMVVMANNLDEYGAIDAKLQEIIDSCKTESVPMFFEFNKRTLGKALGKSLKMAVVGIQNADGAHQEFKKLIKISGVF